MFFWMYALIELLAMFLDSGVIPTSNEAYSVRFSLVLNVTWIVLRKLVVCCSILRSRSCGVLLSSNQWLRRLPVCWGWHSFIALGRFIPLVITQLLLKSWYQFLRISCLVIFGVSFFIAIATFKQFAGFKYDKPIGLWIVYILWPLICTVIYVVSQLILVFRTLDDRWPLGDIVFGTAFFTIAQVLLFAFSVTICDAIKHYIDGLFFFTLCMLLSVMMVYKYWDSITVSSYVLVRSFCHSMFIARGSWVLCRF